MRILISNSSDKPIYDQIVDQMKSLILKGDLTEGEALPSIRNLAKELQISVITTKRAYEELENEGFIETVRGKGSFVAEENKELFKEKKLKLIEEKLEEAVTEANALGLTEEEVIDMVKILFEEFK
ncbi:MAG: GntR family transcriptional regulator [Bacillota bacterium]|nr:GntR family transcriptional regulator [Bacillota bacterium]